MMSATDTKTRPAPKAPVKPVEPQATPAPAPAASASKAGQNSNYAPQEVRDTMTVKQAQLRADGWTRPAISAITGFTDSQVWRAQNGKVHTAELERWMTFVKAVDAGEHKPPASARKPKIEDLQAKIDAALKALGDEAKTAAQFKKVVEAAREALA